MREGWKIAGVVAAFVALAAMVALLVGFYSLYDLQYRNNESRKKQQEARVSDRFLPPFAARVICQFWGQEQPGSETAGGQRSPEPPKWTDEVQASSARAVAVLTVALLLINGMQIKLLVRSTRAGEMAAEAAKNAAISAEKQVKAAEAALIASSRPWIQITDVTVTRLEIQVDQVLVWADFHLHALGPSPAAAVAVSPSLLTMVGASWPDKEVRELCASAKAEGKVMGAALFPGDPGKISMQFGRPMKDILLDLDSAQERYGFLDQEGADRLANILRRRTGFTVIACAIYTFHGSDRVHGTSFTAHLLRSRPETQDGFMSEVFDVTRPIIALQDDLRLTPVLFGKIAD